MNSKLHSVCDGQGRPIVMLLSEALANGNFHAEPVVFAADMIALAICEVGSIAERRIAVLDDLVLSGLLSFLTPKPGLSSGFMIPQVRPLVLSHQRRLDPTSANQEDHVSMATHGARRLLGMAENEMGVIAIDLAAAQDCDLGGSLAFNVPLEAARALLRTKMPRLDDDLHFHPNIEEALARFAVARWPMPSRRSRC